MNYSSQIRKIIINEVAKLLDEDYESVKEIESFSNDVLKAFAKDNIDEIINKDGNLKKANLSYLSIQYVYAKSGKNYSKIKEFVNNANVIVSFVPKNREKLRGYYSLFVGVKYNPVHPRELTVFFNDDLTSDLQEKIEELKANNMKLDVETLQRILSKKLLSPLIHELYHAYDDYRSKGKAYETKEFKEYLDTYIDKIEYADKQEELTATIKYLQLPHEVWARFAQAMVKIEFTSGDLAEDKDGKFYIKLSMKPLRAVLNSFFYKFENWAELLMPGNSLSKIQKRLIKAVVNFWNKEQDVINSRNKNPKYLS